MSMKVCFIYVLLWKCIVLSVKLQIWPNRRLNQFLLKGEQFLLQYCDPSHYKIVFHEWWLVIKDWQICLLVTISLPRTVYAPRESLYLDIGPDHFCFCTPPPIFPFGRNPHSEGLWEGSSTGTLVQATESREGACESQKDPIVLAIDVIFWCFLLFWGEFSIIFNFRKICM